MKTVSTPTPKTDVLLDGYRLGTDQGSVAFCSVTLVEAPDGSGGVKRILVDTGHTGRRPGLDAALARRGLTRDSVDVIVCTHAHWDHVENIDMFPRAEIVLHADERSYARSPHRNDFGCPEWIDAVLARYEDRVRTVEEGAVLVPGVEIVEAPGHSAGTIAVTVTCGGEVTVIAGDSIQNSLVAREGRNALVFWDDDLATRSIAKLLAIGDVICPGHDLPFRLLPGGRTEYLRDPDLTLTGIDPGQPGVRFQMDTELQRTIMPGIEEQRLPARNDG
jgi:glyoxylase-like metal-dependent hydrolase (beta-lactamase superfamily II)